VVVKRNIFASDKATASELLAQTEQILLPERPVVVVTLKRRPTRGRPAANNGRLPSASEDARTRGKIGFALAPHS